MDRPKLVLMTVGAFLANFLRRLDELAWKEVVESDVPTVREGVVPKQRQIEARILAELEKLDLSSQSDLQRAGPEIKSLAMLGMGADDRVVLYASDSSAGVFAAGIVAQFVRRRWKAEADVQVVEGLQVTHEGRFRSLGIQNYVRLVIKEINPDEHGQVWQDIVFNATAGFKGVVPYTTIIGLLFGVPVKYVFEESNTLITLPPLPVSFDGSFVERVAPLLARIEDNVGLPQEEVLGGLSPEERDLLLPLLEPEGDKFLPSALGFLLKKLYAAPPVLRKSTRLPKEKDHTRKRINEPNRAKDFEHLKERLAELPYVEGFHYRDGADVTERKIRHGVGGTFYVTCHGIELVVSTTATHESQYPIIEDMLRRLLESER